MAVALLALLGMACSFEAPLLMWSGAKYDQHLLFVALSALVGIPSGEFLAFSVEYAHKNTICVAITVDMLF